MKFNGGSVKLKLGYGVVINENSSLERTCYVLNDTLSPLRLYSAGITTYYYDSRYRFKSKGAIEVSKGVKAYEIHHVLYDVFGKHIKTLRETEVADIYGSKKLSDTGAWYANENQVEEFLTSVSYVAYVLTDDGKVWKYNPEKIKQELRKIEISYEEGFAPNSEED